MAVRVGVIGVGYLGQHHARIYSEIEVAELVAVVDVDLKRAGAFAEQYNCEASDDYRKIFEKVDALSIVTPTTLHYEVALECLRAGKDILIEKPITTTVAEADELISESRERNCIIQVGHLERYNPAILAAADFFGSPVFIESERLSPFLGRATDVDVTLDLMIHDIDIMLSLIAKPVKTVRAVGGKVLTDKLDVAKAWLEFEGGCAALATVSRMSPEKRRTLKVFQKDALISIDYQNAEIKRFFRKGEEIASETIRPEKKEPLREELQDFIRCVRDRSAPKVSAVEGRDALRIVLEINEMIKNGS
ncbi:MAG TPA: Gfo/Idh/MocA family oxidoreductase [Thermodesulfovibrionales bacterium]|nr:Gfo/Idh/MocA family oxidoreductase [Thermodesulfovibrionales bacterium]